MKKSRFSDDQITTILSEAKAGASTKKICCQYDISNATFYKWRKRFGEQSTLKTSSQEQGGNQVAQRPSRARKKCAVDSPDVSPA